MLSLPSDLALAVPQIWHGLDTPRGNTVKIMLAASAAWICLAVPALAHNRDQVRLDAEGIIVTGTVIGNGVATVERSTCLGEPGYDLQDAPLLQAGVGFSLDDNRTLMLPGEPDTLGARVADRFGATQR